MPPIIHQVHNHSENNIASKKHLLSRVKYWILNLSSTYYFSLSMNKKLTYSICYVNLITIVLFVSTKFDYDNYYKYSPKTLEGGRKRVWPWQRAQGRLPKGMRPGLKSEGCTGGHLLSGGQAEKRAGESWGEPDFWSTCWEWRAPDNKCLGCHVKPLSLHSRSSARHCSAWTREAPFWKDLSGFSEQTFPSNFILMCFQIRLTWLQKMALTQR